MTFMSTYPGPTRRRWRLGVDGALVVIAIFAALVLSGSGGQIAMLAIMSVIGIPLGLLILASVPALAVLLPMRLAHPILAHSLPQLLAVPLSAAVGVATFATIDAALKHQTDGTLAALSLVAQDSPLLPVDIPENRLVGLYLGDANTDCHGPCLSLLRSGQARSVVMMSSPTVPAFHYARADADGACIAPARQSRHNGLCTAPAPSALPMLTYSLEHQPRPPDMPALTALWRVTVRSGAVSQSIWLVEATVPQDGGLLTPSRSGTYGEHISYLPNMATQTFAVFDTAPARNTQSNDILAVFETAIQNTWLAR